MSVLGSSISAGASIFNTKATNEANKETTQMTNDLNKQIADKNLALQREQYEYQKSLNDIQMQREDTAIQRMVSDARNAGVSPLANLQGSSSTALTSAPAPQSNMHYEGYNHQSADLSSLSGIGNILNYFQNYKSLALDNERKELENEYVRKTMDTKIDNDKIDNILKRYNALDAREKRYYNNYFHINDNMSDSEKSIRILNTLMKNNNGVTTPTMTGKAQRDELENPNFDFSKFTHFGYFDNDNLGDLNSIVDNFTKYLTTQVNNFFPDNSFPEAKLKRMQEIERKNFQYHGNLSKSEKKEYEKLKQEYLDSKYKSSKKFNLSKMLWNKLGASLIGD